MADDKKNIPDAGKVNEPAKAENTEPMKADPPVPEQPAPAKTEAPAEEEALKTAAPLAAKKAPAPGAEQPALPKEDKPQPDKTEQQVTIPGMGDPAPAGKVVDFTAARDGTTKGKPLEKDTAPDKGKQPDALTPRRGRPPKESKSAPGQEERFPHSRRQQSCSCWGVQSTAARTAHRVQGRHPPGQGGDRLS